MMGSPFPLKGTVRPLKERGEGLKHGMQSRVDPNVSSGLESDKSYPSPSSIDLPHI